MSFITQGKTNLTYILIVVILAVIVGGGILGYYYSWIKELETKLAELELKLPEGEKLTREQIINYVTDNISVISPRAPILGATKWYVTGYAFTSDKHMYVDFEDGHIALRALLVCTGVSNNIKCDTEALFEPGKGGGWIVVEGQDTQKDKPIIHK